MVPRSLKGVICKSDAPLSLLDCIVLKNYPVYCLEFFGDQDSNAEKMSNAMAKKSSRGVGGKC